MKQLKKIVSYFKKCDKIEQKCAPKKNRSFTLPEISVALIILFAMTVMALRYYLHERKQASIETFKVELATIIDSLVFGGAGSLSGYIYGNSPRGYCSGFQNYLDENLTMGRVFLCASEDYNYSIIHNRIFYQNDTTICGRNAFNECNSTNPALTYFRSIYVPECRSFLASRVALDGNISARLIIDCSSNWSTISEDDRKFRRSVLIKSSAFLQRIQKRTNPKLAIVEDDDASDGNVSLLFPEKQL